MCATTTQRVCTRTPWTAAGLLSGLLFLLPTAVFGQYTVQSQVIAGGGAQTSGGGYVIQQTTAQSGPIGVSSGGSYVAHHGFWHTVLGEVGPLEAMVLSIFLWDPTTVRLSWAAVAGATFYDLYLSTSAYFTAGGTPWVTVIAPNTMAATSLGVGNPALNYFFKAIARNATQTSPESNTVGEFDFTAGSTVTGLESTGGGEFSR